MGIWQPQTLHSALGREPGLQAEVGEGKCLH